MATHACRDFPKVLRSIASLFLNMPKYTNTTLSLFLNIPIYTNTTLSLFLNITIYTNTTLSLFLNIPTYANTTSRLFRNSPICANTTSRLFREVQTHFRIATSPFRLKTQRYSRRAQCQNTENKQSITAKIIKQSNLELKIDGVKS